ncbi:TPA: MobQ family relaxase [Staphylococcus aureus]
MAIFHMNTKNISRGKGQSAIASASYRSGEKLYSERYNKTSFYYRDIMPESFIIKPDFYPEWLNDREKLWNEIENVETSKNSRLAREFDIALPIELSNEKQRVLIEDFIKTNFTNNGLIADIAIHRDDPNNPHFHVMIPTRKFDENGNALPKSKKEYIKDENGKQLYTDSGLKKSRKIDLVGINDKQKLYEWRESWAVITNTHLKNNGINERISHKSYSELGSNIEPTIHEGYVAREMNKRGEESDRIKYNENVRSKNNLIKEKEQIEKDIERIKGISNVERFFNDDELDQVKSLTNELKVFISFDSLIDKERSLNNWYINSITNKEIKLDTSKINPEINNQFKAIDKANKVLTSESFKLINNYYKYIDTEKISDYQARELANTTLLSDRVLNKEEVKSNLVKSKIEEPKVIMNQIIKKPFEYLKAIDSNIDKTNLKISGIKNKYNIDNFDKENIKLLSEEDNVKMKYMIKDLKRYELIKDKLNNHYNNELSSELTNESINNLSLPQKEYLTNMKMYYHESDLRDIINNKVNTCYDKADLRNALHYVTSINRNGLENIKDYRLKEFIQDKRFTPIIINDCIHNLKMNKEEKFKLKQNIKERNEFTEGLDIDDEDIQNINKVNSNRSTLQTLFTRTELDNIESEIKANEREKIIADRKILNQNNNFKRR